MAGWIAVQACVVLKLLTGRLKLMGPVLDLVFLWQSRQYVLEEMVHGGQNGLSQGVVQVSSWHGGRNGGMWHCV